MTLSPEMSTFSTITATHFPPNSKREVELSHRTNEGITKIAFVYLLELSTSRLPGLLTRGRKIACIRHFPLRQKTFYVANGFG